MLGILRNRILSLHYLYEHIFTIPVFIDITNRCNKKCSFCYKIGSRNSESITFDMLSKIIEILSSDDIKVKFRVILFGGEPTLEPEICKYALKTLKERGILVGIFTNNWWIDNINQFTWLFEKEYKPNTIYCSVNNELQDCVSHYFTLSEYCTKNGIELFVDTLGDFPIMEKHCKKHGHFLCKDNIRPTEKYEFSTNSLVDRKCEMTDEGINILVNGDVYLSCDYMQCKLRGLNYLIHDLNSIPMLRKRLKHCSEKCIHGAKVTCGIHANKLIEQL